MREGEEDRVNSTSVWDIVIVGLAAFIPYYSVLNASFIYDDEPAVLFNPDVRGDTSMAHVWMNDFWGTPMMLANSHKSYRPLTTLLYRYSFSIWGITAFPLHLLNNILHSIVTILFYIFCQKVVFINFNRSVALFAGLLFALHPIHSEAVCPVVGCAETLSALCYMISLLLVAPEEDHQTSISQADSIDDDQENEESENKPMTLKEESNDHEGLRLRKVHQSKSSTKTTKNSNAKRSDSKESEVDQNEGNDIPWMTVFFVLGLATHGMLFKEIGITALGVIVAQQFIERLSKLPSSSHISAIFNFDFVARLCVIFTWGFILLIFRLWIMNWKNPTFDDITNPTFYEKESQTRGLTYIYLCWFNFWLLLCPTKLSYDYTKGSIPSVTSLWDARNIASFTFLGLCFVMPLIALFYLRKKETKWSKIFLLGYALMVIPFLPASNLFFPVGFVVAERVLYLPSAGFIIIFVLLWQKAIDLFPPATRGMKILIVSTLSFYLIQTVTRSFDWTSNETILGASLYAYPQNGKMNYNWGTRLQKANRLTEALAAYDKALKINPNDHGSLVNIGRILEMQGSRNVESILELYKKASFAHPSNGLGYTLHADLLRRLNRYEEAATALAKAVGVLHTEQAKAVEAARLLVEDTKTVQSKSVYFRLLKSTCEKSVYYIHLKDCSIVLKTLIENYIPKLQDKGERRKAKYLKQLIPRLESINLAALKIFKNSFSNVWSVEDGLTALLSHIKEASEVKDTKKKNEEDFPHKDMWTRAIDLFKNQRYKESKVEYEAYLKLSPQNLEAKGQYAALLFQLGQEEKGEEILVELTDEDENCYSSGAWHNLATLYGKKLQFDKGITLLQTCLNKLDSQTAPMDEVYRKKHAAIYCQLGKHQLHQGMKLNQDGLEKESKTLIRKSKKNLRKAVEMDSSNAEAHGTLLEISAIESKRNA